MKAVVTVFIAFFAAHFAHAQDVDFNWLAGTWKLKGKPVFEVWEAGNKGELSGKAFRLEGADTVITESIKLAFLNGSYHYIPDVAGEQLPVNFLITQADSQGFVAENPHHDFPKIIRYRYVASQGQETIEASIEGDGKVIPYSFEKIE